MSIKSADRHFSSSRYFVKWLSEQPRYLYIIDLRVSAATSRQDVASVDDSITTGLVTASITSKVQIQSLDLSDVSLSSHGCHAIGFVDHALSCSHLGVEEARRDDIYTSEFAPFSGQRLAQVCDSCLCGVVDLGQSVRKSMELREESVLTGWSTGTLTICAEILDVMIKFPLPCFLNCSPAYLAQ